MPRKFNRPQQPIPEELANYCLNILRRKFYSFPGGDRAFFQHRRDLLYRVVLWPASWLKKKEVTIHGDDYRSIFTKVFLQAAAHVETKIKYPPAYLAQVIQSHFKIHGEEYYDEAKAVRNQVDHVMLMAGQLARPAAVAADPVRELASARNILASGKPKKSPSKSAVKEQLTLI